MAINEVKSKSPSASPSVTQADFIALKTEMNHCFKSMETTIFNKLASVNVITVGVVFIAFAYINDYRLDFTNEQNNARFERLESVTASSSGDLKPLSVKETLRTKKRKVTPTQRTPDNTWEPASAPCTQE